MATFVCGNKDADDVLRVFSIESLNMIFPAMYLFKKYEDNLIPRMDHSVHDDSNQKCNYNVWFGWNREQNVVENITFWFDIQVWFNIPTIHKL